MPSSIFMLPERIWTVATYMFSHYDFLHLLVNMLWLMLFGTLLEMRLDRGKLLAVYVISGLAGAAAFLISNLVHSNGGAPMIGASCAVIGVVGACLALTPSIEVNMLLFGRVKVLWVALAAIVLFIILEPDAYMSIAHGAGLCAGYLWGLIEKGGKISFSLPQKSRYKANPNFGAGMTKTQAVARLDILLEKVSRSGYDSLTAAERQQLFELSQRLK
ncbi:MAG: rhomboid family intramembrane serine protease [Clostridium sp.]|nr:rhomboid family intramembrane serine protease [Clostridium sp.]